MSKKNHKKENEKTKEEISYEDIVKIHRGKKNDRSSVRLENLSVDHAEILFRNLLEVAAEEEEPVFIYSGCLDEDFYGQLVDTVNDTLKKSEVWVAVADKGITDTNPFARAIKESGGDRLMEGVENLMGKGFPHFILVGDRRYRIEKDDQTKEAVACFNDPFMGELLAQKFEKLKQKYQNDLSRVNLFA